ncbi:YALIA101S02e08922g1_1 [Yarrowia lipolytica]|nr:YALIA101S02e08922g1_1 [Yarrowia lipolytica]
MSTKRNVYKKTPQWLPEWFLDESSDRMVEFKTFRESATREEIDLHTRDSPKGRSNGSTPNVLTRLSEIEKPRLRKPLYKTHHR